LQVGGKQEQKCESMARKSTPANDLRLTFPGASEEEESKSNLNFSSKERECYEELEAKCWENLNKRN
jgi:hypothetical protein